jgi:hypothetical protein
MSRRRRIQIGTAAIVAAVTCATAGAAAGGTGRSSAYGKHSAEITNRYLPISDFHRCVLRGRDGNQTLRIVRVLTHRTKTFIVDGQPVRTAVVRDSVTGLGAGRLIERTIDFFAQDRQGGVHYFGEKVDEFGADGSVSHEGEWLAGAGGARPGLLMPAKPRTGRSFKSENAPGIAVESDRVIATGGRRTVRGHAYENVIKIREHATTPKPDEIEFKTYAPGVGVITEANGGVGLVGCS